MLQIIERHRSALAAEVARQGLIAAQRLVDAAWHKVTGNWVEPSPEDTYTVFLEDQQWVVAMFNPYAENVEVSSTDERIYFDCD